MGITQRRSVLTQECNFPVRSTERAIIRDGEKLKRQTDFAYRIPHTTYLLQAELTRCLLRSQCAPPHGSQPVLQQLINNIL